MNLIKYNTIKDFDCGGKRILVRVDLNVPLNGSSVSDNTRLKKIKPNIEKILRLGGKPVIFGHLGRPNGIFTSTLSVKNIVPELERILNLKVNFCDNIIGHEAIQATLNLEPKSILVLENTRFFKGEQKNSSVFSKHLAKLGDLYCNDAFSVCHRAHASTFGITKFIPSFAGELLLSEIRALDSALNNPLKPVTAIVGGSKVSTKIELLQNLISKVENLIIGGGMANTFLSATGKEIGNSIYEPNLARLGIDIIKKAKLLGCKLHLPIDFVTAKTLDNINRLGYSKTTSCPKNEMILDCGDKSIKNYAKVIERSKTVVWNGPLGVFETPPFHLGTQKLGTIVAKQTQNHMLNSIAGGGDTIAALNQFNLIDKMSYVSTAGGAFLEWLEGKSLPGLEALEKKLK